MGNMEKKRISNKWLTAKMIRRKALKRFQPTYLLFETPHKWFNHHDALNQELTAISLSTKVPTIPKINTFLGFPRCKRNSPKVTAGMFKKFDSILKENKARISLFNRILLYERIFFPYLNKKEKESHARDCDKLNIRNRLKLESPIKTGIMMTLYSEIAQHNSLPEENYHHTFPHILQVEYEKYINSRRLKNILNHNECEYQEKQKQGENEGIINGELGHRLMEIHKCFKKVNELLIINSFIFEDTRLERIIDIVCCVKESRGNLTSVLKEIFPFASTASVQEALKELTPIYMKIAEDRQEQSINVLINKDVRHKNTCQLYEITGDMKQDQENMEVTDSVMVTDSDMTLPEENPNEEESKSFNDNSNELEQNLESISSDEDWDILSLECISSPECWFDKDNDSGEVIQLD